MPHKSVSLQSLILAAIFTLAAPIAAAAALTANTLATRAGGHIPLVTPGKWLLVNYWATWCEACQQEAPVLAALARQPAITVLGLSDETIDPPRFTAWLGAHPIPYRVALVNDRDLPPQFPPKAFLLPMRPISYLVRPDGVVAHRFVGALESGAVEKAMAEAQQPALPGTALTAPSAPP